MTAAALQRIAIGFFVAYAIFVTFPGVVPFRGPRPFILGLPLPMVWIAAWVVGGCVMLWLLDRAFVPRPDGDGDGDGDAGGDVDAGTAGRGGA
jgi:hypothetical protein